MTVGNGRDGRPDATATWVRRFRAARVTLPCWGEQAPHRLVYASNAPGVWQVYSWDLKTDRHTQITAKPTGVLGGRVTPDGSGVVWFDDHAGNEVGRYVLSPFDGGPWRPLVDDLEEGWSEGLSLRPNRLAVGISDREGFRIAVHDDAGLRCVYRHQHPASVGGLSKDGLLLAVTHTEHGDVLHPALRVVDPDGRHVGELWDGVGNTVAPAAWSPLPGDPRLAVLSDRTGHTRPELWHLATGERTLIETGLPGEVWVADWWPDARALLLAHDHLGRTQLYRYELSEGRLTPLELGAGTIRGARVREDASVWYALNTSARPPQVRTRTPEGLDAELLTPRGQRAPEGVAYRSISYDNGEGGEVHAFLAAPAGPGPFPLVVDVHGGPHAQVQDTFDPGVQAWVDHGFAVLQPNYRGSTGYGKRWEDALQGDPGRPELVDVRAGRDHLVELGLAEPGRVVLTGGSWGGYLTLLGIGTQPESWSIAVAVVPVADYIAAYRDESPALQEFDRSLFGGTPDDLPDLYRERSPLTYVDRVRVPVLVVTGANDTRCPKQQVDNYIAALAARGLPHEYDVFDAGHGSLAVEESIRQHALALDFVSRHLGTAPPQR